MKSAINSQIRAWTIALLRAYIRYFPVSAGKTRLWTDVIDARFAWGSHEFVASTIFGARIAGNSQDIIQQYIYYFGVWEPHLTAWIQRRLKPGDTFIDVGGNIGYFSLLASQLVADTGSVVAIEASPRTFEALQHNLSLNNAKRARIVNMAASDHIGTLKLFRGPDVNIVASSTLENEELTFECEIPAAPLSDILRADEIKSARLIKIDVEGAEWSVIEGMKSLWPLFRADIEIIVEVNPELLNRQGRQPAELISVFQEQGFHAYRLENDYEAVSYIGAHAQNSAHQGLPAPSCLRPTSFSHAKMQPCSSNSDTGKMDKYLIINADDLGHTEGVTKGIEECHRNGIVTSASLMVNRPATASGIAVALRNPGLSVGLHVNLTDENPDDVDLSDTAFVAKELSAQYEAFCLLVGRKPTHLDSHHHIHWNNELSPLFQQFAAEHDLSLRHYSKCQYVGGFYGQWEHGITDLTHVQPDYLCELLTSLEAGLHEIACHPGYVLPDLASIYSSEREEEIRTLTNPAVAAFIKNAGFHLCSHAQ